MIFLEICPFSLTFKRCFPRGSDSKAPACNAGDPGSIPGSGRSPGEGKWQSTPVFLPGKFHGLRSLVGHHRVAKSRMWLEQLHFLLLCFKIYCSKAFHCILIFKSGFVFLTTPCFHSYCYLSSLSLPFKKTWSNVCVFYSLFKELCFLFWFFVGFLSFLCPLLQWLLLFSCLPVSNLSNCIFLEFFSPSLQLLKLHI